MLLTKAALTLCAAMMIASHNSDAAEAMLSSKDVRFVNHDIASGAETLKLAKLGTQKAQNSEVRAFAESIVSQHTKANEDMAKLASAKGLEISVEDRPAQALIFQRLEKTSGVDFDHAFVSEMVSSHTKNISAYKEVSEETKDNDLKARVDQMIPELKAHLTRAEQLDPASKPTDSTDATNTALNKRDRDDKTKTPLDQGSSKSDVEITSQIRRAIVAKANMSVNAQNVKIITLNGQVTLRGPVNTADEKRIIGEIAGQTVHTDKVDNQLDLKSASGSN